MPPTRRWSPFRLAPPSRRARARRPGAAPGRVLGRLFGIATLAGVVLVSAPLGRAPLQAQTPARPGTASPGTPGTGGATPNVIVGGGSGPSVWFSPDGETVSSPTLAVTISWCDAAALQSGTRTVTLDGAAVSTDYVTGSYSGCTYYATSHATLTLAPGAAHTLAASISDASAPGSYSAQYTYTPPPIGVTVVSPKLYRDPSLCTLDCGERVQGYSTPAYQSLNTARSVSVVYRSGRAWPHPMVEVDVGTAPANTDRIGLKLLTDAGAQVPLFGQGNELVRSYVGGTPNRLAVQFDATQQANLAAAQPADFARVYTAVVTAYQGTTQLAQVPVPVRVPVD